MRAKQLWAKLPDVDFIEKNMEVFWTFVAERQAIWHRRFIEKLPPPWTKDPILRDYKFTNVYRELDYGTIWYMKRVVPWSKKSLPPSQRNKLNKKINLIWMTVMYRLINRVETFEEVGLIQFLHWDSGWRKWKERFEKRERRDECIFTNAHLTLPTHTPGQTKLEKYFEVLHDFHENKLYDVVEGIHQAESLEEVFNVLLKIDCVGRFIGYEICCDLILCGAIPFTENDWVNPGPGCKHGINLIWPRARKTSEYQGAIRWLTDNQKEHFRKYALDFKEYKHPMTLRGIEHSLCEYQKYYKMTHKAGKQRMHFKPRDWGQKILEFK